MNRPKTASMWQPTCLAAALALWLVSALLLITSVAGDSLTTDEYSRIPQGYYYWSTGRYSWGGDHPPLLKLLVSAPLLLLGLPIDPRFWSLPPEEAMDLFMFDDKTSVDLVIWLARFPIILLTLALIAFLGWWARRWYGPAAGLLALFLAAFNPEFLAHGRLATNDLGVAAFLAAALFAAEGACQRPSPLRLMGAGVMTGLALLSKFSAILLGPMLLLQLMSPDSGVRRSRVALRLGAIGLIALAVVELGYRVQIRQMTLEEQATQIQTLSPDDSIRTPALGLLSPLPGIANFCFGLGKLREHAREGHPAFLWGHYTDRGWWYYFPIAFAIKTPLPLLALIGIGLAWRRGGTGRREWRSLVGPMLVFGGVSVFGSVNIGNRHLLPVYPLLIVWVSRVAAAPLSRVRLGFLSLLGAWYLVGALLIHPHYLAYFNELAGGPDRGWRYVTDSNVDWGQDTKRLAAYVKTHNLHPVSATLGGRGTPAVFRHYLPGITRVWPPLEEMPTGYYAIGRTARTLGPYVARQRFSPADADLLIRLLARLDRLTPIATIGYSIDLFDLRPEAKVRAPEGTPFPGAAGP